MKQIKQPSGRRRKERIKWGKTRINKRQITRRIKHMMKYVI